MKLQFVPAELILADTPEGRYVVTLKGAGLIICDIKRAVATFNELRASLSDQFPATEASPEERATLLKREIGDAPADDNHYSRKWAEKRPRTNRTFH